ncbi:hypothetical protein [Rhodophyticola porphyridii]|uniref:Uncharacterized protein n=1 Tax=Rhodophyticola porphyridii TaxID=1852017 RepID=A0A3L9Y3G4_9RHOB|nr:hypothetical protein [Rhodophyticola porphyridii]RMA43314.1 hypothetical protein D9R08_06820 [Rhodophyticola porphyridii]
MEPEEATFDTEDLAYFPYSAAEVAAIAGLARPVMRQRANHLLIERSVPNRLREHAEFAFSNFYDILAAVYLEVVFAPLADVPADSATVGDAVTTVAVGLMYEHPTLTSDNVEVAALYIVDAMAHMLRDTIMRLQTVDPRSANNYFAAGVGSSLHQSVTLALSIFIGRRSGPLLRDPCMTNATAPTVYSEPCES